MTDLCHQHGCPRMSEQNPKADKFAGSIICVLKEMSGDQTQTVTLLVSGNRESRGTANLDLMVDGREPRK